VRLGLVTGAGFDLPLGDAYLADYVANHCWHRFWTAGGAAPHTRNLCFGHAQFMLFLLAHVQKAALLVFADRLVEALRNLNVSDADKGRVFKREIRAAFEGFLRFTQREVIEQAQSKALYRLQQRHLEVDALSDERLGWRERLAALRRVWRSIRPCSAPCRTGAGRRRCIAHRRRCGSARPPGCAGPRHRRGC
jgi:hypothetical protein